MVALIGEGQEIHLGEESGLAQWNDALSVMQKQWTVHCPEKITDVFTKAGKLETNNVLDLSITLRSHLAEDVAQWIKALLAGDLGEARTLAERVSAQGFDVYITNDINVATNYVKERYKGQEDKRYGLLARLFRSNQGLSFLCQTIFLFATLWLSRNCHYNQVLFDRRL